jgi:hypothetical protein
MGTLYLGLWFVSERGNAIFVWSIDVHILSCDVHTPQVILSKY